MAQKQKNIINALQTNNIKKAVKSPIKIKYYANKSRDYYNPITNIFDNWDWSLTPNALRNTIRQACYKYFEENHTTLGKLFKKLKEPFLQTYNEK